MSTHVFLLYWSINIYKLVFLLCSICLHLYQLALLHCISNSFIEFLLQYLLFFIPLFAPTIMFTWLYFFHHPIKGTKNIIRNATSLYVSIIVYFLYLLTNKNNFQEWKTLYLFTWEKLWKKILWNEMYEYSSNKTRNLW